MRAGDVKGQTVDDGWRGGCNGLDHAEDVGGVVVEVDARKVHVAGRTTVTERREQDTALEYQLVDVCAGRQAG